MHYLSFGPAKSEGLSHLPLLFGKVTQRTGVVGNFTETYKDDLLIQGLRNAALNEEKGIDLPPNLKKMSPLEVLVHAKENYTSATKARLRELGKPADVIRLRTLDLNKMIIRIQQYKTDKEMHWAFFSGTYFHKEHRHNCASIILDVLYAGGLDQVAPASYNNLTGLVGGLLGVAYAYHQWDHSSAQSNAWIIASSAAIGRATGAAYDGYHGIQSFLNVVTKEERDSWGSVLGLRINSAVCSAIVGIFKSGPFNSGLLTLPEEVGYIAVNASRNEQSLYTFKRPHP